MSMRLLSRLRVLLLTGLVVVVTASQTAAPAMAQSDSATEAKAKDLYKKGKTQYDLGNFSEAIELFKRAYELAPFPNLLYNIAQSYRQMGDCQALFFYKRYLLVAGSKAKNRKTVESRITELMTTCKAIEDSKDKPPPGTISPEGKDDNEGGAGNDGAQDDGDEPERPGTTSGGTQVADGAPGAGDGDGDGDDDDGGRDDATGPVVHKSSADDASRLVFAVEAGTAFIDLGGLSVDGAQLSLDAGAAYPLQFGKAGVELGGLVTYTPLPWQASDGMSGTAGMTTLLANVGVRYWVFDKLSVRTHVGAGILILSGVENGSVFIDPGDTTDGKALGMFNFRVGVGVDYLVAPHFVLSASPFAYSYSPPKADLSANIERFTRIEIMAGLGYRL